MKPNTDDVQSIKLVVDDAEEAVVEPPESTSAIIAEPTATTEGGEPSGSPEIASVENTAVTPQSKLLMKSMQPVPFNQPRQRDGRLAAHCIDSVIIAFVGSIMTVLFIQLVCAMQGQTVGFGITASRDFIMSFIAYALASMLPVLLPAINIQIAASLHENVGKYIAADTLKGPALQAMAPGFEPIASIISFVWLTGPLLLLPVYKAVMQASPLRASIGEAMCGLEVTDEKGARVRLFNSVVRNLLWFLVPFFPLFSKIPLAEKLPEKLDVFRNTFVVKRGLAKGQPEKAVSITYRSFAGVERWVRDRWGGNKLTRFFTKSPKHKAAGIALLCAMVCAMPFLVGLGGVAGNTVLIAIMAMIAPAAHVGAAAQQQSEQNSWLAGFLFLSIFVGYLMAFISIRLKPTNLLVTPEGISFFYKHTKKRSPIIKWQDLAEIKFVRDAKNNSSRDKIVLADHVSDKMSLKLECLDSVQDKELLLSAVETWAPHLKRNAEIVQLLQPPADLSYTEVWMTALTAPPKRERLKPLAEGVRLKDDEYHVLHSIGTGGQGFAYLAEHKDTKEKVVLKEFILPVFVDVAVRRKALEKFEMEARLLKRLDHDQVVKLTDYFVEDHRAYLVLEYIDGVSLRTLVQQQGKLPQEQVVGLAKQMANILQYLHTAEPPIIHRDFTPDNLILHKDGTLKLIDFNVAQQIDSTVVATVVGKHAYLAPEQFQGMPVTQSDIYSMGATLHYILTGKDPLPISVSKPAQVCPDIDPLLDIIVSNATERQLTHRYQNVQKLLDDLNNV